MRQLTDPEISKIKVLTENAVEVVLIEPTKTGLEKSILDATGSLRNYLKSKSIHDYEQQKQGPENKLVVPAFLVSPTKKEISAASLYRPNTKKGDPRIWFKNLGAFANPNDILGVVAFENMLFILNLTQLDLQSLLNDQAANEVNDIIKEISRKSNEVADELHDKLKIIAKMGLVPALLQADTAIGRTLEHLLGIKINSSKTPDYKGIELKSYRDKRGNRKNLFTQVPEWNLSQFKSSGEILDAFGYVRGEDFKLYCTVSAIVRNSQGLKLKVEPEMGQLIENSDKAMIGDFAIWPLEKLHASLLSKHNETFWIAADSVFMDGKEFFQYKKAEHTKKPIAAQFDLLLEQGIITLDHLIKRNPAGGANEKGPIFKIKPNALDLLFPPSQVHQLL